MSNLCLDGLPGQTWHDWRSQLVQAGKERTNMRICNKDFKERLTELFCLIFGIGKTVYEQKQFLLELANLERDFLFNSSRSGWTATPVLQRIKKTKLYDFVIYFLSCNKPGDNDNMENQTTSMNIPIPVKLSRKYAFDTNLVFVEMNNDINDDIIYNESVYWNMEPPFKIQ